MQNMAAVFIPEETKPLILRMLKKKTGSINRTMTRLVCGMLLLLQINRTEADIPNCAYEDTVDLSGSTAFLNGSYSYQGVVIPDNLVDTYDYEILFDGKSKKVPEHKRGCVCQIKECLKFCCPRNELKVEDERRCSREGYEKIPFNPSLPFNFSNGRNVSEGEFVFQSGLPCHLAYPFEETWGWSLIENNSLYYDWYDNNDNLRNETLSRRDYCITPIKINGAYVLTPLVCEELRPYETKDWINQIAMLISVPFFIATLFIYLLIPKLRTLHGICLSSYLLALAMTFTLLVVNNLGLEYMEFTRTTCFAIGFAGYYFMVATFFWLNVISFDLWRNVNSTFGGRERHQSKNKRFLFYALYACGCPLLFTIITIIVQSSNIEDHLKPGIGNNSVNGFSCSLNMESWSAMIYLHGLSTIIISTNIILFIASFLKIYKVKNEANQMMSNDGSYRHVGRQWESFLLYLRLFIVMGVSWIFEVVSYLVGTENSVLFIVTDVCNGLHGFLIFALFVLKPKVLLLIKERISSRVSKSSSNSIKFSGRSTHTSL